MNFVLKELLENIQIVTLEMANAFKITIFTNTNVHFWIHIHFNFSVKLIESEI